ncbi:MAG: glycosyltransferase family 4 protein, partial [Ktedonobacterales bacterium]
MRAIDVMVTGEQPHMVEQSETAHIADAADPTRYRFGFLLQQVLGWVAVYQNFRRYVDNDSSVLPSWIEVTYEQPGGWVERVPALPARLKGAVRGALQVHAGLGRSSLPFGFRAAAPAYDAVLFNSQSLCLTTRDYLRRVPAVIVTDVTPRQLEEMRPHYGRSRHSAPALMRLKESMYRDIFSSARVIAPCSQWVKNSLMSDYGVPEEAIVVVPHGVDVWQWKPPAAGVRAASLVASGGKPRILFVGGDFQRKGGDLLLDWFLERGHETCELHLVTRTPPEPLPRVPGLHLYTGLETNDGRLVQLYEQCHVFVLPTLADCFGVASIEAMATGLPVITTAVGGVPEIVDDGEQGFLIQPGDGASLADRIERLVGDESLRKA